jgi:formylglycine-generating enzyme required for sulfatase activity
MKIFAIIFAAMLMLSLNSLFSQTMRIQTKNGNKTYNVSDVHSITFGIDTVSEIEMVLITSGTFQMGQADIAYSTPVHTVIISRNFWMGKYEVTQKQYKNVMGSDPSHFLGDNNPVDSMNWYDAVTFCIALSQKEGLESCYSFDSTSNSWLCDISKKGYRLPTEAEWEYACRAGTLTDYYSGNKESQLDTIAWYDLNSNLMTHPVGQKIPNNFGLYDMEGNVNEWCWDWEGIYSDSTVIDPSNSVIDPMGADFGTYRVARGGAYGSDETYCRCADRESSTIPGTRWPPFGFRVVRTQ